jgi:hypothetical protein
MRAFLVGGMKEMGLPRRFRWIHFFVLTNDAVYFLHCKFYFCYDSLCVVFHLVFFCYASRVRRRNGYVTL